MAPDVRAPDRAAPARAAVRADVRAAETVAAVEAERAALAAMLHDKVCQSLIAARFTADLAGAPAVAEAVKEAFAEAQAAMWALRPRTADGGLLDALGQLATRHRDKVVAVRGDSVPDRLDVTAATVAYRVVQAALDACSAGNVDVRVEVRAGVLTVSVCDDGPAYDAAVHEPGSELTRWLAYGGSLGGRARVGDGPTGGTTLWLEIPDALPKECP
jgi:signal transduction histidine kinase